MGHQIIRQPDGLLAIFSSFTDTWIVNDATPEDVADYYAEQAAREARRSVERILGHVLAGEPSKAYYQFALSFDEANAMSGEHGGEVLPVPAPEGKA
jgi:hypothetical protein